MDICSFFRNSALACAFLGDPTLTPVERWSLRHANKADPDEIIAAAIVQSFVKDYDDWQIIQAPLHPTDSSIMRSRWQQILQQHCPNIYHNIAYDVNHVFVNEKKEIVVIYKRHSSAVRCNFYVNEIEFPDKLGNLVIERYVELKTSIEKAKATAAKAEAEMKRSQDAWNLAEKLLGFKRNEHGALMPAKLACCGVENEKDCKCFTETKAPRQVPKKRKKPSNETLEIAWMTDLSGNSISRKMTERENLV